MNFIDYEEEEVPKYKKRSKKKKPKKSRHKHIYREVSEKKGLMGEGIYLVTKECEICGKEMTDLIIKDDK